MPAGPWTKSVLVNLGSLGWLPHFLRAVTPAAFRQAGFGHLLSQLADLC
ncbi:MAG: hypothetical protein JWL59_1375 [Chthoniobacteraceae bacterium]|nr:hypothetical protein [Chthoniobacteraceae bacterium]